MSGSVDRLTEVLRVGLRLREDLAEMPTGVRWENGKVVSVSKEERALLLQLAPREDMVPSQPPSLRKMWRFVNKRSQDDLLDPLPSSSGAPGPMDDDGFAPSDDEEAAERRRAARAAQAAEDSDDSEDAPLARRGVKRPDPATPKAPKSRRRVIEDESSSDEAPPVNPWRENYEQRRALEEARKAKEDAEEARKAAEAAEAEAAAKAEREALVERYRLAEEAAKARAEAEAKAKAEAEAAAAAKAAEEAAAAKAAEEAAAAREWANSADLVEEEGEGEDVVEITEEEQAAEARLVTVGQAYGAFVSAWNGINMPQLYRDVDACGDDEAKMEALFPRVTNLKQVPEKGAAITAGPLRFAVYRFNKKSVTLPQQQAMPGCQHLLEKIDNFYFHSPDAVFAGGGEFRGFLQSGRGRFASWFVDVKSRTGYRTTHQNLQFDSNQPKAWKIQATFVTHIPKMFNPPNPDCKLVKIRENWVQALRYVRAAEEANKVLNAGHAVPAMLQMRDGPRDHKFGVIGYDTPLDVPEWAKALLPKIKTWSDSNFPTLTPFKATRFGRGGQRCTVAERVLQEFVGLSAKGFDLFKGVVTHQFTDKNTHWFKDFMDPASTKFVGLAAWGKHARIVYKNSETKVITIYDPWKQAVRIPQWMQEIASAQGYTSKFENRDPDQTPEGSCQLQATMRVLMAAVHGQDAILQKLDVDDAPHLLIYPVVTQLIYSKFRQRKR